MSSCTWSERIGQVGIGIKRGSGSSKLSVGCKTMQPASAFDGFQFDIFSTGRRISATMAYVQELNVSIYFRRAAWRNQPEIS
jgi:hypothetical protein